MHTCYRLAVILDSSRMRVVTVVKRCVMEACGDVGGLTRVALTERMKRVPLDMEENTPRWNPRCADAMMFIGIATRVCKPYRYCWRIQLSRSISWEALCAMNLVFACANRIHTPPRMEGNIDTRSVM